jgi:hypothetical protein
MQTLIFQIINRLQFNKIGIKFQFYQLPRELPESQDVIKSGLSPETLSRAQVTIFKDGKDKLKERLGIFAQHPEKVK